MKSWSKRELALAVLVIFAAPAAPYIIFRLWGDLMSLFFGTVPLISTLLSLFLYACISALVTGVPFFPVGPEGAASLALDPGAGGLPGAVRPLGHEFESDGRHHRLLQYRGRRFPLD